MTDQQITDLTQRAEQGDMQAQISLGFFYWGKGNGVPLDLKQAEHWWDKAASQGDIKIQKELAQGYKKGASKKGVPPNHKKAAHWWLKGAEQGHPLAQFEIGYAYYWGDLGVPKDLKKALHWYKKAAEQGESNAKSRLPELQQRLKARKTSATPH